MKYIKQFEDLDLNVGKYYWKIKSLPMNNYKLYFIKLLETINCQNDIITELLVHLKYLDKESPTYITLNITDYKEIWNIHKIQSSVEQQGFVYQGLLELSDQEIKEIEIEQKYNL